MNFWTASVKVGVMVLVAIVFLTILLTNAENWPWATAGDELTFQFRSVNGLYVGAAVYLYGVPIGKVTAIELRPDTCLLYTSPSPRDRTRSRMPSSA